MLPHMTSRGRGAASPLNLGQDWLQLRRPVVAPPEDLDRLLCGVLVGCSTLRFLRRVVLYRARAESSWNKEAEELYLVSTYVDESDGEGESEGEGKGGQVDTSSWRVLSQVIRRAQEDKHRSTRGGGGGGGGGGGAGGKGAGSQHGKDTPVTSVTDAAVDSAASARAFLTFAGFAPVPGSAVEARGRRYRTMDGGNFLIDLVRERKEVDGGGRGAGGGAGGECVWGGWQSWQMDAWSGPLTEKSRKAMEDALLRVVSDLSPALG